MSQSAMIALAAGIPLSFLLFGTVWSQTTLRARAVRIAEGMTQSLQAQAGLLDLTHDGVLLRDRRQCHSLLESRCERPLRLQRGGSDRAHRGRPLTHTVSAAARRDLARARGHRSLERRAGTRAAMARSCSCGIALGRAERRERRDRVDPRNEQRCDRASSRARRTASLGSKLCCKRASSKRWERSRVEIAHDYSTTSWARSSVTASWRKTKRSRAVNAPLCRATS